MTLIVILIILAIVFGLTGALVEGLMWLLIIGAILFVVSGIMGFSRRGRR
jgi:hypothetical protein